MTRGFSLIAIGALLALTATQTFAAGDPARGKTKIATCVACHGTDGNSVDPQYPRLAGQYADYLAQALHEYKDGRRGNAIMKGFAATLSDQDIDDVSAYFSSMPSKLSGLEGHVQGD
ncbi:MULTISPECIES: cytochrome c [unclassified Luteibacter]|uniref:c-type cytochrome n=1 Tax=unclassified Luteibacter TaxID=2620188 RepID=UPI0008ACA148|nr:MULTISPECIES: cytochrome c [unclassified Luteibacter]MDR6935095.1 cytochrome c553 [Luteibacter sp. 3190]SEO80695.1 Cytochrome c553 [Luteibacter sp. UNC138MFCol5.1]SEV99397.1 Cytochrome c553 [Luteibacter sp. 329MFSha]